MRLSGPSAFEISFTFFESTDQQSAADSVLTGTVRRRYGGFLRLPEFQPPVPASLLAGVLLVVLQPQREAAELRSAGQVGHLPTQVVEAFHADAGWRLGRGSCAAVGSLLCQGNSAGGYVIAGRADSEFHFVGIP